MEDQKGSSDEKKMKGNACACGCGGCSCGSWGGWRRGGVLRILIALFVAFFLFWLGVKVGEIRTQFGSGRYGGFNQGSMMYRRYPGMRGYQNQVPMMGTPATTSTSSAL